jgi:hypothetical protein
MAKLSAAMRKKVDATETMSFEPVPNGIYRLRLVEVTTDGKGPAGPYWTWIFKVDEPEDSDLHQFNGRKLWHNTSLSDDALFKMKEVYAAMGYTLDSDTDEMCGDHCRGLLTQATIEKGNRKGEKRNEIVRLMDADGADDDDFDADDSSGGSADDGDGFGDDDL